MWKACNSIFDEVDVRVEVVQVCGYKNVANKMHNNFNN